MGWAAVSWYSILLFIAELLQRGQFGYQVHPMIQTLFPNNDAVYQDVSDHIDTANTVKVMV
jgi:hypothetical protein